MRTFAIALHWCVVMDAANIGPFFTTIRQGANWLPLCASPVDALCTGTMDENGWVYFPMVAPEASIDSSGNVIGPFGLEVYRASENNPARQERLTRR